MEPAVEPLRLVWLQNVVTVDEAFRWRTNDETPPTGRNIGSPYDVDVRYATKRQTHWVGYHKRTTKRYVPVVNGNRPSNTRRSTQTGRR